MNRSECRGHRAGALLPWACNIGLHDGCCVQEVGTAQGGSRSHLVSADTCCVVLDLDMLLYVLLALLRVSATGVTANGDVNDFGLAQHGEAPSKGYMFYNEVRSLSPTWLKTRRRPWAPVTHLACRRLR